MKYNVKVIPRAKVNKIVEESQGNLKVYFTAPAVDGKANKALIQNLADYFNIKKRQISIIRGEKSRQKIIQTTP